MLDKAKFGENLFRLRKKAGLSQEELATRVGVHLNTISQWENGFYIPKTLKIQKLAEVLSVSESELLNGPANQELEVRIIMGGDTVLGLPRIDLNPNEFVYQLKNNSPLVFLMGCVSIETPEERQKARDAILENFDKLCQMHDQK